MSSGMIITAKKLIRPVSSMLNTKTMKAAHWKFLNLGAFTSR